MVQIIDTPSEETVDVVCTGNGNGNKGCGAKLRFEREELRYYPETEKMFSYVSAAVVAKCPICGETTDLEKKKWPKSPETLIFWTGEWARDKPSGGTTS